MMQCNAMQDKSSALTIVQGDMMSRSSMQIVANLTSDVDKND